MTVTMKASIGDFLRPRGVGRASEVGGTSKAAPSLKPALPIYPKTKGSPPSSGSRHNPKFRSPKGNWNNKGRNDKGKQHQRAPQPEDNHRSGQEQHHGQRPYGPQYRPQFHRMPAKVVLERPDYFNYNPSNGLHTPGPIYPGAYGFAPRPMGFFPTLPPSHPMFMSIPPSPPRIGQFDPTPMPFAALSESHNHRIWDELEEVFPMWSPPRAPVDPFIDPVEAWTSMRSSQAGYQPQYYQPSTLRPWANEFVPGRLFHPILGW
ncbi:hypothetical protein DPV78_010649 [Talaromyces pinophilus]|nr:hypothetical protein DPV78_010649 [Talaromyces pinophilus]